MIGYNEIIPGRLWVGSFCDAQDARQLWRLGITGVLSLQSDQDIKSRGIKLKKLFKALEEVDIEFLRMPVQDFDEAEMARQLPFCVAELEAALAPGWARVYMHCTAGINRSPTVAAAYLIKSRGWTAQETYKYLLEKRACQPYFNILETYEKTLLQQPDADTRPIVLTC
jgi:protein-tyrosine phosphatase